MSIARAGWKFIVPGFIVDGLGVALIVAGILTDNAALLVCGVLVSLLASGFAAFSLYFFRDPERPLPADAGKIYSPGDGRVLSVADEGKGVVMRMFLSVFDVHIQRSPCSGKVEKLEYRPGAFRAAMIEEAKLNERSVMTVAVEGRPEKIVVEQIAGYVARRIETWPKLGEPLKAGQRYGIIYFGSQAAVHFPPTAKCAVKPGDRLVGGVSPIGEWTS